MARTPDDKHSEAVDEMRSNVVRDPFLTWPKGLKETVTAYSTSTPPDLPNGPMLQAFCTRLLDESWSAQDVARLHGSWEMLSTSVHLPADIKTFTNTITHAIEGAQRELKLNFRQ